MNSERRFEEDLVAFGKAESALRGISESGVDSGAGLEVRDFWLRINGAEYFVQVSRSKRQQVIDSNVGGKRNLQ